MEWVGKVSADEEEESSIAEIKIGSVSIALEIPKTLHDAISENRPDNVVIPIHSDASEKLASALRSLLPKIHRPATTGQISYATAISETLEIELPYNIFSNSELCREFIGENKAEFDTTVSRKKEALTQSTRVERWSKAIEYVKNDLSMEDIATKMEVMPITVEEYIWKYNLWKSESTQEEQNLVFAIGKYRRLGFDPYKRSGKFILSLPDNIEYIRELGRVRTIVISACYKNIDGFKKAIKSRCIGDFLKLALNSIDSSALDVPEEYFSVVKDEFEGITEEHIIEWGWYEEFADV